MEVELISYPNREALVCEKAAAICTGTKNSSKALKAAMASGHTSVLEHANYTFKITNVSRILLAQLTRHRIASYSVKSQRYINHGDAKYYIPETILKDDKARTITLNTLAQASEAYRELVDMGIPKEDARYLLPQGIMTDLILTMNARELHHFFSLRCCNRAQTEIRKLADGMLALVREVSPEIFANAGPRCVTENKCYETRPCGHPRTDLLTQEGS